MGCYQDALCNIMPVDWLDPYGRTPFAKDAELSVDITIVETQDGIRASSVKNPPTSGSSRLMDAIKGALGMACPEIGPQNGLQRSDDLGKCEDEKSKDKPEKSQDYDIMKSTSSGDSRRQGSQPWSSGKSPEEPVDKSQEKDAKEKAPKF